MYQKLTRALFLTLLTIFLWCPSSALADGFVLKEQAEPGNPFIKVVVMWTNAKHETVTTSMMAGGPSETVTFFTSDVEKKDGPVPPGTIRDWKQFREQQNGQKSTLEGVFAKKGSPFEILSYDQAYLILGLRPGEDFIFLPDFSADLDNDGFAETHLFSAINLFDLALNFPQFVNNQPFVFGQSYTASQFTQFGFVFSVTDNIQFDPDLGYITSTPFEPSGSIIANSTHITAAVPEPASLLLLGSGLAGVAIKTRKKLKSRKRR